MRTRSKRRKFAIEVLARVSLLLCPVRRESIARSIPRRKTVLCVGERKIRFPSWDVKCNRMFVARSISVNLNFCSLSRPCVGAKLPICTHARDSFLPPFIYDACCAMQHRARCILLYWTTFPNLPSSVKIKHIFVFYFHDMHSIYSSLIFWDNIRWPRKFAFVN